MMAPHNGGTHRATQTVRTVLVALIAAVAAAPFAPASTEVVAVWTRIYRNAETLERRLEVVQRWSNRTTRCWRRCSRKRYRG